MSNDLNKTNENINYVNYTNSSAVRWKSSSANSDSFATIIRNKAFPEEGCKSEPSWQETRIRGGEILRPKE
jgi:hypothetical protein